MLDAQLEDWPIVKAVLDEATDQRSRYDQGLAKYISHTTAGRTVAGITKTLNALMKSIRASQA